SVVPITPFRILDTRIALGVPGTAKVAAGATIDVQMSGVGPVPADAIGVVLNLTGTEATAPTFVTAWPTGELMPTASSLNLTPGVDAPNGVTVLLGAGGKLSLFNNNGSTHLVADVTGYLVTTTPGGKGEQGEKGDKGDKGDRGDDGQDGDDGAPGAD